LHTCAIGVVGCTILGSQDGAEKRKNYNAFHRGLDVGQDAEWVTEDVQEELVEVLTFHVLLGHHDHGDFTDRKTFKTVEGKDIESRFYEGHVYIVGDARRGDYAEVEKADNEASNGVAHIISRVLIPPRHIVLM